MACVCWGPGPRGGPSAPAGHTDPTWVATSHSHGGSLQAGSKQLLQLPLASRLGKTDKGLKGIPASTHLREAMALKGLKAHFCPFKMC